MSKVWSGFEKRKLINLQKTKKTVEMECMQHEAIKFSWPPTQMISGSTLVRPYFIQVSDQLTRLSRKLYTHFPHSNQNQSELGIQNVETFNSLSHSPPRSQQANGYNIDTTRLFSRKPIHVRELEYIVLFLHIKQNFLGVNL